MKRIFVLALLSTAIPLSLVCWAASNSAEVVTHPPTALDATMTLTSDPTSGFFMWNVSGKVSPKFRSEGGTTVFLVATPFCSLTGSCGGAQEQTLIFPSSSDEGVPPGAPVDSCGNFSFVIVPDQNNLQLPPDYFANFIVHVDVSKGAPQTCGNGSASMPPPADPNGSAPCSSAYCPHAP